VGRIAKGFDLPAYSFARAGLAAARETVSGFPARASRLGAYARLRLAWVGAGIGGPVGGLAPRAAGATPICGAFDTAP
jgi:hypothetical protein